MDLRDGTTARLRSSVEVIHIVHAASGYTPGRQCSGAGFKCVCPA
jgi:hypothetical protein